LRIAIGVAAVLAAIPVLFRAPGLAVGAGDGANDVWSLYREFGIVFLALPIALGVLAAGDRYPLLRDAAAGSALGVAVAVTAELATFNQFAVQPWRDGESNVTAGAGWWLLTIAAMGAILAILAWRGLSDRWSPGRWAAAATGMVAVGILLYAPAAPHWQAAQEQDVTSMIVVAVVVGVLGVATFVSQTGAAHFFIILAAAGVCLLELVEPDVYPKESAFVVGSVAVLVAFLVLGLVCNRFSARLFLLTARIGIAVAYLRIQVFPTIPMPDDLDNLYTAAFGLIVVLAVLAARAKPPRPVLPAPYAAQPYGYYGSRQYPYQHPHRPR
jgi:hypothetical protein